MPSSILPALHLRAYTLASGRFIPARGAVVSSSSCCVSAASPTTGASFSGAALPSDAPPSATPLPPRKQPPPAPPLRSTRRRSRSSQMTAEGGRIGEISAASGGRAREASAASGGGGRIRPDPGGSATEDGSRRVGDLGWVRPPSASLQRRRSSLPRPQLDGGGGSATLGAAQGWPPPGVKIIPPGAAAEKLEQKFVKYLGLGMSVSIYVPFSEIQTCGRPFFGLVRTFRHTAIFVAG